MKLNDNKYISEAVVAQKELFTVEIKFWIKCATS